MVALRSASVIIQNFTSSRSLYTEREPVAGIQATALFQSQSGLPFRPNRTGSGGQERGIRPQLASRLNASAVITTLPSGNLGMTPGGRSLNFVMAVMLADNQSLATIRLGGQNRSCGSAPDALPAHLSDRR